MNWDPVLFKIRGAELAIECYKRRQSFFQCANTIVHFHVSVTLYLFIFAINQ
ncbi:hypothetical protein HanPSC8_Chr01g0039061 [Helianthus annuus]|nr:hypothetical protein HanPSC8_Chr01g0039061 [Helianthus annuus]